MLINKEHNLKKFKKKKKITEFLFQQYSKKNILYKLVNKIYCLLKEQFGKKLNTALEDLLVSQKDIKGEEQEIKNLNDLGDNLIIEEDDHFNCHVKGTYYYNGKMFQGD